MKIIVRGILQKLLKYWTIRRSDVQPTLKCLLYVPNIGPFWQYIVCTAELA